MTFKTRNILVAGAVAAVVTLIIRLTVFTEDCNLLVVAMTFLSVFVETLSGLWILRFFRTRT